MKKRIAMASSTLRQRLWYITKLNSARIDYALGPMMSEVESLPTAERAAVRILFALAKRSLKVDIVTHPSHLLLLLLSVIDDTSFESIWDDYAPLVEWATGRMT